MVGHGESWELVKEGEYFFLSGWARGFWTKVSGLGFFDGKFSPLNGYAEGGCHLT